HVSSSRPGLASRECKLTRPRSIKRSLAQNPSSFQKNQCAAARQTVCEISGLDTASALAPFWAAVGFMSAFCVGVSLQTLRNHFRVSLPGGLAGMNFQEHGSVLSRALARTAAMSVIYAFTAFTQATAAGVGPFAALEG